MSTTRQNAPTFGTLARTDAGWGATAFRAMSLLTMFVSITFDPRLMWDAAESACPTEPNLRLRLS